MVEFDEQMFEKMKPVWIAHGTDLDSLRSYCTYDKEILKFVERMEQKYQFNYFLKVMLANGKFTKQEIEATYKRYGKKHTANN